ncbi:MAG TPA: phosphoenolpyruvate carboxykinase [Candidatus Rifleibacterium sp.]|nr:phosphoenolpyruvate carboxykinase [Candidatus Rifleibacterium sp.]
MNRLQILQKMALLWTDASWLPQTTEDLLSNSAFEKVVRAFVMRHEPFNGLPCADSAFIIKMLRRLEKQPLKTVMAELAPDMQFNQELIYDVHQLVESLYDFWRRYERFLIVINSTSTDHKAFKDTVTHMNHLVRKAYREICENITSDRPRVYRQLAAGFQAGMIARTGKTGLPAEYGRIDEIPVIRQVLLNPPLIIDPPVNKRTGEFIEVDRNPLINSGFNPRQFICFPAMVGELRIDVYFHAQFINLGTTLCNLFELADEGAQAKKPDAIYFFGLPGRAFKGFAEKTVFFDDRKNDLLIGAVPLAESFGYFGYLKKMVLTLHNIIMMKRGRMPVHGAMFKIELSGGKTANILVLGDTGAGKSETIEAFRALGSRNIKKLTVIFDDMGSLKITDKGVMAYGTETGAFVRLDDLSPGYAFGNIDRSIIMSPHRTNARVVLPVTTMTEILRGRHVDLFLYANNYEEVDSAHPVLEEFKDIDQALNVFREGTSMSKGTTTSTGIVHSYFANVFGPSQFRDMHEKIAHKIFQAMLAGGTMIGQLRTRLGIDGYQSEGPKAAAKALLVRLGIGSATDQNSRADQRQTTQQET